MSKYALINVAPFETRLVITHHGMLHDVFIERASARSIVGNVYLGTVIRVLPAIGSVFIDIGQDKPAFLHQSDIVPPNRPSSQDEVAGTPSVTTLALHQPSDTPTKHKPSKPSKCDVKLLLRLGERVVVQVTKDEYGTKGARVTMHIALPSRYLVYLPTSPKSVGVSTRITKQKDRIKLKAHLDELLAQSSLMGAVIARSACEPYLEDEALQLVQQLDLDLAYLGDLWRGIGQARTQASLNKVKFALLHQELALPERAMRDIITDDTRYLWVDDKAAYEYVMLASQRFMPSMTSCIGYHAEPTPLFTWFSNHVSPKTPKKTPNIETQIQDALLRHYPLPSGGYILIEHTEAMTTIDVNTGSFVGQGRGGARAGMDVVYETNKEAAVAIARELRVRNIGGIIIIDFIDMNEASHRQKVLEVFTEALKDDSATTNLTQISELGLVEMTRKRTRPSLSDELCVSCPTCHGVGRIKSVQTVAFDILRAAMSRLAESAPSKRFAMTIKTSQAVAEYLGSHQDLANLQNLTKTAIHLHIDASYHQEQYVILME